MIYPATVVVFFVAVGLIPLDDSFCLLLAPAAYAGLISLTTSYVFHRFKRLDVVLCSYSQTTLSISRFVL